MHPYVAVCLTLACVVTALSALCILQTVRSQNGFCSCNCFEMEQMNNSSSSRQTEAAAFPRKEYF